ncbi:YqjD family protein [Rhizobium sp. L1K21]|uniref:DUF883 family protein n=1 Tax=Rhizobium sp. L1K21 TaxID=2954933 RepID=UPI002092E38D|nr:hypothetical protein [Rhizobium sp. L1K21]MCO6184678.1 hypothetical protein [Rhizobium sp. L1K21]
MATTSATKNNGSNNHAQMADIEEQLAKLSEEMKALTSVVSDFGSGKVSNARAQASDIADELKTRSVSTINRASKTLSAAETDFEDQIRTNPLAAVGIAAGVGFLLAMVTKR